MVVISIVLLRLQWKSQIWVKKIKSTLDWLHLYLWPVPRLHHALYSVMFWTKPLSSSRNNIKLPVTLSVISVLPPPYESDPPYFTWLSVSYQSSTSHMSPAVDVCSLCYLCICLCDEITSAISLFHYERLTAGWIATGCLCSLIPSTICCPNLQMADFKIISWLMLLCGVLSCSLPFHLAPVFSCHEMSSS